MAAAHNGFNFAWILMETCCIHASFKVILGHRKLILHCRIRCRYRYDDRIISLSTFITFALHALHQPVRIDCRRKRYKTRATKSNVHCRGPYSRTSDGGTELRRDKTKNCTIQDQMESVSKLSFLGPLVSNTKQWIDI